MTDRRARDKAKTTQDILAAARRLFSEKGLHGTSIRDIEQASGVSKGLILHHFTTKEQLYAAVQDLLAQEYIAFMSSQRQDSSDLRQEVEGAIRSSFRYTRDHRDYRRMALWSSLEGQERTNELEERFIRTLMEVMRQGQANGQVRKDIDPFLMPFIIKGAIDYWLQKGDRVRELAQGSGEQPEELGDRLVETLASLFLV